MRRDKIKSIELKLDLHGITYNMIEELLEDYCYTNTPPFKIITGNSNKMKNLVIDFLNKNNFKYMVGNHFNQGFIHVL
tara:strand:+ start:41 stop:274 length:234 start_codon:yes stop_codon:yes gene_type:complete